MEANAVGAKIYLNNVWVLKNSVINSGGVGVSGTGEMNQLDSEEAIDLEKEVYIDYDAYLEEDTSIFGKSNKSESKGWR